jgi:hypothetical protein
MKTTRIATGMSSTSASVDEVPHFPMNATLKLLRHATLLKSHQQKKPIALGGGSGMSSTSFLFAKHFAKVYIELYCHLPKSSGLGGGLVGPN